MGHRLTKPLVARADGLPVDSDGYRLVELAHKYTTLRLDQWQADLIVRILERCPPGHARAGQLRYRQVVVSIPRQAGKSVIASVLALYGLLQHSPAPKVLGVARAVAQANHVYGYTKAYVNGSDALRAILRPTGTRGITKRTGEGSYIVLPGNADALQGYPSTLAVCDELHIMKPETFDAIVTSQRAQEQPLLVGITTAGDINSVLLKRLYAQGEAAIAGSQETFGFFCWESSSDQLTLEAITEANPAVACGRISAEKVLEDERHSPASNWKRYALNRFVDGAADPWVPVEAWANCAGTELKDFSDCVYSFDITDTHSYMTIMAAKVIGGVVHQSLVARVLNPTLEDQKAWADRLRENGRCSYVMDPNRLRSLTEYLDSKNRNPIRIFGGRKAEAAAMVYQAVSHGQVNHDNNALVNAQHATAKIKTSGDGFVVVPNGKAEIDACYASIYAIYGALVRKERSIGIA